MTDPPLRLAQRDDDEGVVAAARIRTAQNVPGSTSVQDPDSPRVGETNQRYS